MNELGFVIAIVVSVFCIGALAFGFVSWLKRFKSELKYLNIEIARTKGREKKHWKKKKRRLFLSIIPFVRY